MAVTNGWGQGALNNTIGWGQGAWLNTIGWGNAQETSWSGDTTIYNLPFNYAEALAKSYYEDVTTYRMTSDEPFVAFATSIGFDSTNQMYQLSDDVTTYVMVPSDNDLIYKLLGI